MVLFNLLTIRMAGSDKRQGSNDYASLPCAIGHRCLIDIVIRSFHTVACKRSVDRDRYQSRQ
jgi:hypothetical protein